MPAAEAQAPAFDFGGRVIRFLVGQAAGGVTDLEVRLLAQYIGDHLPGRPAIVVEDITGAGGLRMLEYFTRLDPAELAVAVVPSTVPFRSRAGRLDLAFDPLAANWLGSFADSTMVCLMGTRSGIATIDDMRARDVMLGLLSIGGANNAIRLLLNHALGLRLEAVAGYDSLATLALAMGRGEIDGLCSPYSSYPVLLAPMVEAGTARIVLYLGPERRDDIAAPYLFDLPMAAEELEFLNTAIASISFARPLAMPAGADPAFVAVMRAAFDATMADPAFQAAAGRAGIDVRPVAAGDLAAAVAALHALPDETIARINAFLFDE